MDSVRDSDVVARLGGDEFGVLLSGADQARAALVAERILAVVERPFLVEDQPLDVGISIGIAMYPEHGSDAVTLMQRADVAMYAAKRTRSGRAIYTAGQANHTPRRMALSGELRRGIEDGQLLLHYQPKIDLGTMRAVGAEALVRWLHPREGLILPDEFIPLAEYTGLIRPLGLWALNTALLQCRVWHRMGLDLNVAVNLAPESLQDAKLVDEIGTLLESSDALPQWLTVEVTEGAVIEEPARAKRVLDCLHKMGVRIALDDFGTGYSSLTYLREMPVDEVKVDRGFVRDMASNRRDACIVKSVIDLGHNLGHRIVAEGVEDEAGLQLLTSWGCDLAQGYYFSRPLPPPAFLDWMAASNGRHSVLGSDGTRTPSLGSLRAGSISA